MLFLIVQVNTEFRNWLGDLVTENTRNLIRKYCFLKSEMFILDKYDTTVYDLLSEHFFCLLAIQWNDYVAHSNIKNHWLSFNI